MSFYEASSRFSSGLIHKIEYNELKVMNIISIIILLCITFTQNEENIMLLFIRLSVGLHIMHKYICSCAIF